MDNGTCNVAACSQPIKRRALCYAHYMKWWRYGTPTPTHKPRWQDLTGSKVGSLTVLDRVGNRWRCQCDCGAETVILAGDLNRGSVATCGDRAVHHRRETAGYEAAHGRIETDRGPAAEYRCVDCGGSARHWSYDHTDPDERLGEGRWVGGLPYSLDPSHYSPRCVPCHKTFDLARLAMTR